MTARQGTWADARLPNVFPLHLAPIDSFFCADDTALYPMTFVVHLDFEGSIDVEAFNKALDVALLRHPLLRAVIRPAKRGLPCWVSSGTLRPRIDWGAAGEPVCCPGAEGIDLRTEVGVRFWIRADHTTTQVTVQVHHACTDGIGFYRFLGDLLAVYGMRTSTVEPTPKLDELDPRLLRVRRRRMADLAINGTARGLICRGLREAANLFCRRVEPMWVPDRPPQHAAALNPFPGVRTIVVPREQHDLLRTAAGRHGGTLNDLLLAELFRTTDEWNARGGRRRHDRRLRIMMPSDLRGTRDYYMPAANMTSYTFITRRRRACRKFDELMRGVYQETSQIKGHRQGTNFVDTIMLSSYVPQILPFLLKRNRCIATSILSNVGDPSRRFTARFPRRDGRLVCGNLTLEQISGVPPLRRNTHATLSVFTYRRKLTISARCDPYLFSAEQTQEFLDTYRAGLLSHLSECRPRAARAA